MPVRRVAQLAALIATLAAATLVPAPPAAALHNARTCGSLAGYKVQARGVGCRFARRWAPRSFYHRRRPAGWRCSYGSRSSSIRVYCYSGSKAYTVQR